METDNDHIHFMKATESETSVSKMINLKTGYTTYCIWKRYPDYLQKCFGKEHDVWKDRYFVCSVENVSEEM